MVVSLLVVLVNPGRHIPGDPHTMGLYGSDVPGEVFLTCTLYYSTGRETCND